MTRVAPEPLPTAPIGATGSPRKGAAATPGFAAALEGALGTAAAALGGATAETAPDTDAQREKGAGRGTVREETRHAAPPAKGQTAVAQLDALLGRGDIVEPAPADAEAPVADARPQRPVVAPGTTPTKNGVAPAGKPKPIPRSPPTTPPTMPVMVKGGPKTDDVLHPAPLPAGDGRLARPERKPAPDRPATDDVLLPTPRRKDATLEPAAPSPTPLTVAADAGRSALATLIAAPPAPKPIAPEPKRSVPGPIIMRSDRTASVTTAEAPAADGPAPVRFDLRRGARAFAEPVAAAAPVVVAEVTRRETHFAPVSAPVIAAPEAAAAELAPVATEAALPTTSAPTSPLGQVARALDAALPAAPNGAASTPGAERTLPQPTPGNPVRLVELQLAPATLGTVTVTLRLSGTGLKVAVQASQRDTADRLGEDRSELTELVRRAGYGEAEVTVEYAPGAGGGGSADTGGSGNSHERAPDRRERPAATAFDDGSFRL